MTPPARVERQPRSACVEPVTDVKRCVEETLRDEGLGPLVAGAGGHRHGSGGAGTAGVAMTDHECGMYELAVAVAVSLGMLALAALWLGLVLGGPR